MASRPELKNECSLFLKTETEEMVEFTIDRCIGRGANSIVYEVRQGQFEIGRLKEFYPCLPGIMRGTDGKELVVAQDSPQTEKEYYGRREEFIQLLQKRKQLRELSDEICATMPEYCALLFGNNTSYIFQSYSHGLCYANVCGESFQDMIKTAMGLVAALKCYHKIGYVHLDVKPENMLINTHGSNDVRVQLFDFETVTRIDELKDGKVCLLPYSEGYSAPEQKRSNCKRVGVHTDIYSVGVILFERIMGRFPDDKRRERCVGTYYVYDFNTDLFADIVPLIRRELDLLFHRTIMESEVARYKNDDELLAQLIKILNLSSAKKGIVQTHAHETILSEFYGRNRELSYMDELFLRTSCILLYGMGGIGKSELVKQYIACNAERYYKVVYIVETGNDIKEAVVNDSNIRIDGLTRSEGISDEEYFRNKIRLIQEEYERIKASGKELLLVFDNMEYFRDLHYLKAIVEIGCHCIFISRDSFDGFPFGEKFELERIQDEEEAIELFLHYYHEGYDSSYNVSAEEKQAIREIVNYYDGHTLILELMAKEMNNSWIEPVEALPVLKSKGLRAGGDEKIPYVHDDVIEQKTIDDIVYGIFDLQMPDDEEIDILQFMSLAPAEGIGKTTYRSIRQTDDLKHVKHLIKKGIIKENRTNIQIHPIIREMVERKYPITEEGIRKYIGWLKEVLSAKKGFWNLEHRVIVLYLHIGKNILEMAEIKDSDFYDIFGNACHRAGWFDDAIRYYEKCISLRKELYGEGSKPVALACMRMGRVLKSAGRYEESLRYLQAAEKLSASIVSATGVCAGSLIGTFVTLPLLGSVIARNIIGINNTVGEKTDNIYDKRLDLAKVYNQLALWHLEQGDYEKALNYGDNAYTISEERSKDYERADKKLFYHCDTMGKIACEIRQYEAAEQFFQRAIRIKDKYQAKDDTCYISSYFGIARCRYYTKDFDMALEFLDKAMLLSENKKGIGHIDTAKIYHYRAKILYERSELSEAEMYAEQAYEVIRKLLGNTNQLTICILADCIRIKLALEGDSNVSRAAYAYIKDILIAEKYVMNHLVLDAYKGMKQLAEYYEDVSDIWEKRYNLIKKKYQGIKIPNAE